MSENEAIVDESATCRSNTAKTESVSGDDVSQNEFQDPITPAEERTVGFTEPAKSASRESVTRKESELSSSGIAELRERRKSQAVVLAAAATKALAEHETDLDEEDLRAPSMRDMRMFFNAARDKFKQGFEVIKIATNGQPYKRKVHINAKPEYFEISSNKLFDVGHHLLDITLITMDDKSQNFRKFRAKPTADRTRVPPSTCCTVHCSDKNVALVFRKEADRNEFVYVLRVSRSVTIQRYLPSGVFDSGVIREVDSDDAIKKNGDVESTSDFSENEL